MITPHTGRRRAIASVLVSSVIGAVAVLGAHASPAKAAFDIQSFSAAFTTAAGDPVTQAGSHPDLTVDFSLGTTPHPIWGAIPDESIKNVTVDLPVGFYGNPTALPTCDLEVFSGNEGTCTPAAQVGMVDVQNSPDPLGPRITVPLYNMPTTDKQTAVLGFSVGNFPITIEMNVRTDGDYGLRATVRNTSQTVALFGTRLRIWGVPADPVHDPERWSAPYTGGASSNVRARPFLTAPPRCDAPLEFSMRAASWQNPDVWDAATTTVPAMTGCEKLRFDAGLDVSPESRQADTPTGYAIGLSVPQEETKSGTATPHIKSVKMTLPEGVVINPGSADGLEACSDAGTNLGSTAEPNCPLASRIGTVSVRTPVLAEPLTGEVILRSPQPGTLFRLMLVVRGPGLVVKLPGIARPNPVTGQIVATFENTPQLPFDLLEVSFKGGSRAPLANPQTCGTKTTVAEIETYAGQIVKPTDSFEVTGCDGRFEPTFEAGTVNPLAGAYSPFTMTIRRADGMQNIGGLSLDMPPGLLGSIKGIPQCPEVRAVAGTCGEESRIGSTTVQAGSGATPYTLPGKVFLGGPYKGAPFSLSVVVRAVAGPFDLGTVVVRAPINVDAAKAKLDVPSDPLPTILEGVPFRLKTINITMDRPGFMFNATNCTPMFIGARITSTNGAVATPSARYQAQGCGALPLEPELALTLSGEKETTDGKHPGINAVMTQKPGESGLKKVAVKLPLSLALDPDNAQALCKPEQAAARNCPAGSIIGRATAVTPALNEPLTGPIYFVENTRRTASGAIRRTLPKLWLALKGEVPLDLYAQSDVEDDHLVTEFDMIPDAPISRFDLQIAGGKNGVIVANTNICQQRQVTTATFHGQTGKRVKSDVRMQLPCGFKVAKRTTKGRSIELTLSGLKAGKVRISGEGIKTTSRTIKRAQVARITASLTDDARATVRRRGKLSTKVTVTFTPSGSKKSQKATTTLTYRR